MVSNGSSGAAALKDEHPGLQRPRFSTIRSIGRGGQGFVQLCLDTQTGEQVAIKYLERSHTKAFYKYVTREILHHQQLTASKHAHIVEFHEVFLTPRYLGVVMEYVDGPNLQEYLAMAGGKLTEDVARFIFQQLVITVDFCHRKGKVNRDIKPANVLVHLQPGCGPIIKLCDFGFSKDKFQDSQPHTQVGTVLFIAPEIFSNLTSARYDGELADVWSLGVVLHLMLFGGHPFLSAEDAKLKANMQVLRLFDNCTQGLMQWHPGGPDLPLAADLLQRILVSDPAQRYKIADIMRHPWFSTRLPQGAERLNEMYLSIAVPDQSMRQSPSQVRAVMSAAVDHNCMLDRGAAPPQQQQEQPGATPGAYPEPDFSGRHERNEAPGNGSGPPAASTDEATRQGMQAMDGVGPPRVDRIVGPDGQPGAYDENSLMLGNSMLLYKMLLSRDAFTELLQPAVGCKAEGAPAAAPGPVTGMAPSAAPSRPGGQEGGDDRRPCEDMDFLFDSKLLNSFEIV